MDCLAFNDSLLARKGGLNQLSKVCFHLSVDRLDFALKDQAFVASVASEELVRSLPREEDPDSKFMST